MSCNKVLTFRASSIGDCLMGKYMLDNIHAQYPQARLGLVVASRAGMIRDLFAGYPYIEVVEANRRSPASLWRLWRGWRGSDLVVTQYAGKAGGRFSFASKLVARLLSKKLVGFSDASRFNAMLYDRLVTFDPAAAPAEMERQALRAAGLAVPLSYPHLDSTAVGIAQRLGLGRYVVVNLFSGSIKRGLNPSKRRELVATLRAALPREVELVLTGGPADQKEAADAAGADVRSLAGQLNLHETVQLVAGAVCVVSLDTGVAHIAVQLGKPAVVLASCLGVQWWGPEQYGPSAAIKVFSNPEPGGHAMVDYPPCINNIDTGQITAFAASLVR